VPVLQPADARAAAAGLLAKSMRIDYLMVAKEGGPPKRSGSPRSGGPRLAAAAERRWPMMVVL